MPPRWHGAFPRFPPLCHHTVVPDRGLGPCWEPQGCRGRLKAMTRAGGVSVCVPRWGGAAGESWRLRAASVLPCTVCSERPKLLRAFTYTPLPTPLPLSTALSGRMCPETSLCRHQPPRPGALYRPQRHGLNHRSGSAPSFLLLLV